MQIALAGHDALIRAAILAHGGSIVKTMGDAFHAAFVRVFGCAGGIVRCPAPAPGRAVDRDRRPGRKRGAGEELEMGPLQARCYLGLGKLLQQAGRRDAARAALSIACIMLREMGMERWLPKAKAALRGRDD